MGSLLGLMITNWDHEPRPGGRWRASVLDCGSPLPLLRPQTRFESARGLAHSKTWRRGVRFLESTVQVLELISRLRFRRGSLVFISIVPARSGWPCDHPLRRPSSYGVKVLTLTIRN